MDREIDRYMDGWMEILTDYKMGRWMDRKIDRWIDR